MASSAASDGPQFLCPHCRAIVSARWEDLGETVECPLCRQPFDAPAMASAEAARPTGRLFRFQCLRCGSVLEARASQAGRRGKCPSCAALFLVPTLDPRTGLASSNADPGEDGEHPTPVHAYAAAGEMAPRIHRKANDELAIECPRCHAESQINVDNCSKCGLPFTLEGMTSGVSTSTSGYAPAALALGLLSIPLSLCGGIGMIPAGVALILGVYATRVERRAGFSAAHAGILLGLAGAAIAVWVFL